MIVRIGHFVKLPTKARHVIVKCRIGPVRGHDPVAVCHHEAHKIAQQPVDAFANDDVLGRDAMMRCKGRAQIMALGIAIHPLFGFCHRIDRAGGGAKDVLVRPQPRAKGAAHGAFLRFGTDKRHGRG